MYQHHKEYEMEFLNILQKYVQIYKRWEISCHKVFTAANNLRLIVCEQILWNKKNYHKMTFQLTPLRDWLTKSSKYSDIFVTSNHQFGFKVQHSTTCVQWCWKKLCIIMFMVLFVCTMSDATKAFDKVKYCKLFQCLMTRKLPYVVLRLLYNLYTNHVTRVLRNTIQSRWFGVLNGVKQGGVLSPVLFCTIWYVLAH